MLIMDVITLPFLILGGLFGFGIPWFKEQRAEIKAKKTEAEYDPLAYIDREWELIFLRFAFPFQSFIRFARNIFLVMLGLISLWRIITLFSVTHFFSFCYNQ